MNTNKHTILRIEEADFGRYKHRTYVYKCEGNNGNCPEEVERKNPAANYLVLCKECKKAKARMEYMNPSLKKTNNRKMQMDVRSVRWVYKVINDFCDSVVREILMGKDPIQSIMAQKQIYISDCDIALKKYGYGESDIESVKEKTETETEVGTERG